MNPTEITSLDQVVKIRAAALNNEDIPPDTLKACIEFLRKSRSAAPAEKKAKATKLTGEELLENLFK